MSKGRSEAEVLRECLRYLKLQPYFFMRNNVGAAKSEGRFVKFGMPGMADILVLRKKRGWDIDCLPIWVECKAENGKQSAKQQIFQAFVEVFEHRYIVVHSVDELIRGLE